jgi:hypothetical protein
MTTPIDTQALRFIAQAATPGTWSWWTSNSFMRLSAARGPDGGVLHAGQLSDGCLTVAVSAADAAHIAAVHPAAVLALLDEIDRLRAEVGYA